MSGNNGGGNGSGQGPPVRRPHPSGSFGNVPANRAETKNSIIKSIFKSNSSSSSSWTFFCYLSLFFFLYPSFHCYASIPTTHVKNILSMYNNIIVFFFSFPSCVDPWFNLCCSLFFYKCFFFIRKLRVVFLCFLFS